MTENRQVIKINNIHIEISQEILFLGLNILK